MSILLFFLIETGVMKPSKVGWTEMLIVLDHCSHIMMSLEYYGHIPAVMRPVHKVTN